METQPRWTRRVTGEEKSKVGLEAVVFDMDGLLLDTEPLYQQAWRSAAAELGFDLTDTLHQSLIGRNDADSHRVLEQAFGRDFSIEPFIALWPRHWERHIGVEGIALKAGTLALLQWLETSDVPFAIATSSHRWNATRSLECTGLLNRFPTLVTGDEVANGKPAPDIYLEAAQRLATAPERCLAFEDSDPGVIAATEAGMTTILVPDLMSPSEEAVSRAHQVLPSLESATDIVSRLIALK